MYSPLLRSDATTSMLMQDDHNSDIYHWCSPTVHNTKHVHTSQLVFTQLNLNGVVMYVRATSLYTAKPKCGTYIHHN